jgi:hypothetical protein
MYRFIINVFNVVAGCEICHLQYRTKLYKKLIDTITLLAAQKQGALR